MYRFCFYCQLLYLGFTQNIVDCTNWVDDLTSHVVKSAEFKQVKFMTALAETESIENPLIEELFVKLMRDVPTVRINFEQNFKLPVNSVLYNTVETKTLIDTTATLFLFVIESRDGLTFPVAKNFIAAAAEMTKFHDSPKFLIVTIVEKPSESLKKVLKYAWTKKMLDFTIVELVERKYSIGVQRTVVSLTIYQFNPFKKEYTGRHWTAGENNLFPNKVNNLWGYPLIVGGNEKPPSRMEISFDPSLQLLDLIVRKLNCSVRYVELLSRYGEEADSVHSEVESKNLDLVPGLFPHHSSDWNDMLRTTTLKTVGIYFLVPVLTKSRFTVTSNFFPAFFLSAGIISIFWIFMRLLGFQTYLWRVFSIGRVIFGVSVIQQPRRIVERVVFTCLLAICAFYSSTIYAGLMDITLQTTMSEIEFDTFEDLANSDLIFQGDRQNIERAYDLFGGPSKVSPNRFVKKYDPVGCVRALNKYKNVSCLMDKSTAITLILFMNSEGRRTMKLAKPRLVTENYSFVVGKRSPYRATINKFIERLQKDGIIDELYYKYDADNENFLRKLEQKPLEDDEEILKLRLLLIAVAGYSLSIVVFIGEIIIHRLSLYIKSKRRPLPPPFPFSN